jgi:hypothetical protein
MPIVSSSLLSCEHLALGLPAHDLIRRVAFSGGIMNEIRLTSLVPAGG